MASFGQFAQSLKDVDLSFELSVLMAWLVLQL